MFLLGGPSAERQYDIWSTVILSKDILSTVVYSQGVQCKFECGLCYTLMRVNMDFWFEDISSADKVDEMTVDKMKVNEMTTDKMTQNKIMIDKMKVDEIQNDDR